MKQMIFGILLVVACVGIPAVAMAQPEGGSDIATGGGEDTAPVAGEDTAPGSPDSGCGGSGGTGISNPLKNICSFPQFIQAVFERIVLPLGLSIAVLFIIYSGFLFVVAQGNETKLARAKSAFFWSVIGTAVLLGSWVIATLIENTINELTAYQPQSIARVYEI